MITSIKQDHPMPAARNGGSRFHVVINDADQSFCFDGPEANAWVAHLQMQHLLRTQGIKLRELGITASSHQAVLAHLARALPGYSHLGGWAAARSVWDRARTPS